MPKRPWLELQGGLPSREPASGASVVAVDAGMPALKAFASDGHAHYGKPQSLATWHCIQHLHFVFACPTELDVRLAVLVVGYS